MSSALDGTRSSSGRRKRPYHHGKNKSPARPERLDAASIAAKIELQHRRRELVYSLVALAMKSGLLLIGAASLFRLGLASHHRLNRHLELSSVLNSESVQLSKLRRRFDSLFTIGGERRLMDEQEQWIAPNRVRVIWR